MKVCNKLKRQSGVMLLEALIAILIFSLGILSLVALQATSIKLTGDARYRANAGNLVEKLFSEMRMSRLNGTQLKAAYASDDNGTCDSSGCVCEGGSAYVAWCSDVQSELAGLIDLENAQPAVTVDDQGVVTVTIFWRSTPDANVVSNYHKHTAVTQIRG